MEPIKTQLSNGQIVDAYPLTQAQKFMFWAFNTYGKVPATLNIGTGEYWKGDFDSALMREAIEEAIERSDCFRIRLIPDQQYGTLQYIVPKTESVIEEIDHTNMTYDESYEIIKSWSTVGGNFFESPLNTVKIMHLPDLKVTCTCVRVPVVRSHSISVSCHFGKPVSVAEAREAISRAPGCRLVDDLSNKVYPMPLDTSDQDIVFVGRIRPDLTDDCGISLWCCGDQVRKGAATNAIQIAELLIH